MRRGNIRQLDPPPADWAGNRRELVGKIRDWIEQEAVQTIDWYFRDKATKRVLSRLLHGLAIVLAVAGGLVPLIALQTGGSPTVMSAGYIFLALAGGCVAFDRLFGVSSGWMRDMVAIQTLQRLLLEFRLAWFALESTPPAGGEQELLAQQLTLISRFALDTNAAMSSETTEWLTEFRTNVGQLSNTVNSATPQEPTAAAPEQK